MLQKRINLVLMLVLISLSILGCTKVEESLKLNAQVSFDNKYLSIENKDDFVWDKAEITINDKYKLKTDFLAVGKSSLELTEFSQKTGDRFNPNSMKINKITIYLPKSEERQDGFWFGEL